MHRHPFRARLAIALLAGLGASFYVADDAHAQVSGATARPLPNILLLVDNSGSMERKPDNSLPVCVAGDSSSEVNRWGMLLQALTGNFQPYFSCAAVSRAAGQPFVTRYSINGNKPYDTDYFLPYNQPMTGSGADACVMSPWKLPGAADGSGVGGSKVGAGGLATDYPDESLIAYKYSALGNGVPGTITDKTKLCTFDQGNDGQLDVARDYARFALMTFDSAVEKETGFTTPVAPFSINTADPFKGMWSYWRHSGNEFFPPSPSSDSDGAAVGAPPACTVSSQEVGARNAGAPPWEGRLIPFADPDASLYDLAAQNLLIQQTLLATRPYGATPIDGLMDDARDYYYYDPNGPGAASGPTHDPYGCRDKYIILLTDGAPNLDLRPSCASGGVCPYPKTAGEIANMMYKTPPTADQKVTTFVIGFSVNGTASPTNNDGFPASLANKNCKSWFDDVAGGASTDKEAADLMATACTPLPPEGTTGHACCVLNEIARQGSEQGAYFAESQADVVLSFGRIMANIIHAASTKTLPAFATVAKTAFVDNTTSVASSAEFVASYVPASQTPWAGELDRTRFQCNSSNTGVDPVTQDANKGDLQSENVARQSSSKQRLFISVVADKTSSKIDSAATIRPFEGTGSSTGGDSIGKPNTSDTTYSGREVVMKNYDLHFDTDWPTALGITNKTCKRGRAVKRGLTGAGRGTVIIPALDGATGAQDCTDVVWGFATATPDSLSFTGTPPGPAYEFNVRCTGTSATTGNCSISGDTCVPQNATCPVKGETCIPSCAGLGAIYHSNPVVVPPPTGTLREEGFRQFQANRATRRPVLYAASTDGILHAFKAMDEGAPTANHELWSFVPPSVLPKLAANYPNGNQILLDGAPIVRETIWDRKTTAAPAANQWHTTLVAGLGQAQGYYALNVTDADCGGSTVTGDCLSNYVAPSQNSVTDVSNSGVKTDGKAGPHFLWQLADVPADPPATETAKITRTSPLGDVDMVALFGKNTGTPAIGTVLVKTSSDGDHQIGVAILPGGFEDPPTKNSSCDRATQPTGVVMSDQPVRANVRQWAKGGCDKPVPGRNLTIARLDTGEIIRVFGRKQDVPHRLHDKLAGNGGITETLFDSPIVGTPVVYPDQPGVPVQKIFVGDADGTLWKIDVSSKDPKDWKAYLFADLFGTIAAAGAPDAYTYGSPISVPPVLSTDDAGNVIVNVASGDQESITYNANLQNYVYSIRDGRDPTTFAPKATTLWYRQLLNERVTGPMTVFDKTLYFATYSPTRPSSTGSAACNGLGQAYLWGLDYVVPDTTKDSGGKKKWCPDTKVSGTSCTAPLVDKEAMGSDLIPGVTLSQSLSCTVSGGTDEYGNSAFSSMSSTTYTLSYGIANANGAGKMTQAARGGSVRQLPTIATQISSWSLVVE